MNSVGLENFSRAYGIEIASQTLGSLIGPVISGVFADSIGSYSISFIILGIITSTGSLISYWKVRNPNSKCPKV
jgi:MFS family permease